MLKLNTRTKGRRAELEFKNNLELDGWTVLLTDAPQKFKKQQDFLGLFDIIAFKGKERRYVQIKSNKKPNLKNYKLWAEKHCNTYETVEIWVRFDRKGWEKYVV